MTPLLLAGIAVSGGCGAVARFLLDGAIRRLARTAFPVGTVVINLSGSLVLGIVAGLASHALLPDAARLLVGTGFLGGYTTFSAASVESVRLVGAGRGVLATLNIVLVPVVAVLLAAAGLAVAG